MDSVRLIFPDYPKGILEEQYVHFYSKLKFMDTLAKDLHLYKEKFPHLSYDMIKNYYLSFLSDLEEYRCNISVRKLKFPLNVIIKIFQYLDFTHVIRFASINFEIYKHFLSFPYISQKLKWEREHHDWISMRMINDEYKNLIYRSDDIMEETYKNQIILKRNLHRIDPLIGSTTGKHELSQATSRYIYNLLFQQKYTSVYPTSKIFKKANANYNNLSDNHKLIFDNVAVVARRYGFIHLFRSIPWCFTKDKAKIILDTCLQTYISDKSTEDTTQKN